MHEKKNVLKKNRVVVQPSQKPSGLEVKWQMKFKSGQSTILYLSEQPSGNREEINTSSEKKKAQRFFFVSKFTLKGGLSEFSNKKDDLKEKEKEIEAVATRDIRKKERSK